MLTPSIDVIPHILTLSTWGFVIFFGLPAVMSIAYELLRRGHRTDRLTSVLVRFLGMFVENKVFSFFMGLCISSFISALMVLLYYITEWRLLITLAYWIEVIILIVTVIVMLIMLFKSSYVPVGDLGRLEDYAGKGND